MEPHRGQSNACNTQSCYMCDKHIHISDMEDFGHDHVEKTMGYEHAVEGTLTLNTTIFCADTFMTTKKIEGNRIFAHVGPNEFEYKHNKNG